MRLLIVDDSALMRRQLQKCFETLSEVEVAVARDGEDALLKLHSFAPDVITLDINMPKMDGLTCLAHIMEERPCPVIMVSSLTEKGAVATFEALELGAADFVAKPDGTVSLNIDQVFEELRSKVLAVAGPATQLRRRGPRKAAAQVPAPIARAARPRAQSPAAASGLSQWPGAALSADLVLIGSSTGGPGTVGEIIEALPEDFPVPVLIAQHMPPRFTRTFAERLQDTCAIRIQELASVTPLEPGCVYIAQGGRDVAVTHQLRRLVARPIEADPDRIWHPSVAHMVSTAMTAAPASRLISVMLTGMGDDGAREMAQLARAGGRTIAEAEETAVIFGMPQQLIAQGGASMVLPCHKIAAQIGRWLYSPAQDVSPQPAARQRTSACL